MAWPILNREQYDELVTLGAELGRRTPSYPLTIEQALQEIELRGLASSLGTLRKYGARQGIRRGQTAWKQSHIDGFIRERERFDSLTDQAKQRGGVSFEQFIAALRNDLRGEFTTAISEGQKDGN